MRGVLKELKWGDMMTMKAKSLMMCRWKYVKVWGKGGLRCCIGLSGLIWNHTCGDRVNLILLSLNNNSLSGLLPLELSNLTSLTHLILYICSFSGTVPSSLANSTNIKELFLFGIDETDEVPCYPILSTYSTGDYCSNNYEEEDCTVIW